MKAASSSVPRALTIAGSDSGGGAGIQTDLKTFAALGIHGSSVITAITAQNTVGVFGVEAVAPEMIARQIEAVLCDIGADAIKIGMLHSTEVIEVVAEQFKNFSGHMIVLDPVMIAKSGDALLDPRAVASLLRHLLPLAHIITPNIPEAETLLERKITNESDMEQAAYELVNQGSNAALIKGGHLAGPESRDCLVYQGQAHWFSAPRVSTRNTHGTGCTLSSAIAAHLGLRLELPDAVRAAKDFLSLALTRGSSESIGRGHGPAGLGVLLRSFQR